MQRPVRASGQAEFARLPVYSEDGGNSHPAVFTGTWRPALYGGFLLAAQYFGVRVRVRTRASCDLRSAGPAATVRASNLRLQLPRCHAVACRWASSAPRIFHGQAGGEVGGEPPRPKARGPRWMNPQDLPGGEMDIGPGPAIRRPGSRGPTVRVRTPQPTVVP